MTPTRYPVTIYFDSEEQRRRFKTLAAMRGNSASELAKNTLVRVLSLDEVFLGPTVPLTVHACTSGSDNKFHAHPTQAALVEGDDASQDESKAKATPSVSPPPPNPTEQRTLDADELITRALTPRSDGREE